MNLIEYAKRLQELTTRRPDLAEREIIVRNAQVDDFGWDKEPFHGNGEPPYWLGCIAGVDIDHYISDENGSYFKSDYAPEDGDALTDVIRNIQSGYCYTGDRRNPEGLTDAEIRKMWDALPWKEAIIADIGVAWG